jgi:hypothetical protein
VNYKSPKIRKKNPEKMCFIVPRKIGIAALNLTVFNLFFGIAAEKLGLQQTLNVRLLTVFNLFFTHVIFFFN